MDDKQFKEIEPTIKSLAGKYAKGDTYMFDELYQTGALAACEAFTRYTAIPGTDIKTFLYYSIRGSMLDALRKERRSSVYGQERDHLSIDDVAGIDESNDPITVMDQVSHKLWEESERHSKQIDELIINADLTEHEELCLRMYYMEELRQQEIATELGISQQAVAKTVNKALNKLQGK